MRVSAMLTCKCPSYWHTCVCHDVILVSIMLTCMCQQCWHTFNVSAMSMPSCKNVSRNYRLPKYHPPKHVSHVTYVCLPCWHACVNHVNMHVPTMLTCILVHHVDMYMCPLWCHTCVHHVDIHNYVHHVNTVADPGISKGEGGKMQPKWAEWLFPRSPQAKGGLGACPHQECTEQALMTWKILNLGEIAWRLYLAIPNPYFSPMEKMATGWKRLNGENRPM